MIIHTNPRNRRLGENHRRVRRPRKRPKIKANRISPRLLRFKAELKANATPAEIRFRMILKQLQLTHMFKFQYVAYGYILDYYCPRYRLGVEIDGSSHEGREQLDQARTDNLLKCGISIIRFRNDQIFNRPDSVGPALYNKFQLCKRLSAIRLKQQRSIIPKQTKIYTASQYSQDQLRSLIPSP